MIVLKIVFVIMFIMFCLLIYGCLTAASDYDDKEEKDDGE